MLNSLRPMILIAGNKAICENNRIRVQGRSNMTLLPDFHTIEIYNMSSADRAVILLSKDIRLYGEGSSIICSGEIQDIYTKQAGANEITVLSVSDGQSFWDSAVDVSFGAGAYTKWVIQSLLLGKSSLGAYLAADPRMVRGQTMSGKTAEIISCLAKSVNARAFQTNGSVFIVEKGKADTFVNIAEEEVITEPAYATGVCILKTLVKGHSVGTIVTFRGNQYRLVAQAVDADNDQGTWQAELVLVDETELDADGMEGG